MAKKKKYYAIKEGRKNNLIVETWSECQAITKGFKSVFKSFNTKEEAEKYLKGEPESSTENQIAIFEGDTPKKKPTSRPKKGSKQVRASLSNEIYMKFINKCKEFEIEEDKIIIDLINEWID